MYINPISIYSNKTYCKKVSSEPVSSQKSQNFTGLTGKVAGGVTGLALTLGIFANFGIEAKNTIPTAITATVIGSFYGSKMEDNNNDNNNNNSGKNMYRY